MMAPPMLAELLTKIESSIVKLQMVKLLHLKLRAPPSVFDQLLVKVEDVMWIIGDLLDLMPAPE